MKVHEIFSGKLSMVTFDFAERGHSNSYSMVICEYTYNDINSSTIEKQLCCDWDRTYKMVRFEFLFNFAK